MGSIRKGTKSERQELSQRIKSERQELSRIKTDLRGTGDPAEKAKLRRKKKGAEQEIFQLNMELRAAEEGVTGERVTGALPDFIVIGAMKCGTTSFYHLLVQHPHVEPAANKELHYFDMFFDEGVEWYRRCFPAPRWRDGRRTITGEATPYLGDPPVPERMARVVPQARLIALLRNPVDRAYSNYHQMVRNGWEPRTFEEVVEETMEAEVTWPPREDIAFAHDEDRAMIDRARKGYLANGVYVDQLLYWSEFLDREQTIVLKSEDFFERPAETLKLVLDFLGLPGWEPEAWEIRRKGDYEQEMNRATRRRLEEYFEPHNQRLYDYLGRDLGW